MTEAAFEQKRALAEKYRKELDRIDLNSFAADLSTGLATVRVSRAEKKTACSCSSHCDHALLFGSAKSISAAPQGQISFKSFELTFRGDHNTYTILLDVKKAENNDDARPLLK